MNLKITSKKQGFKNPDSLFLIPNSFRSRPDSLFMLHNSFRRGQSLIELLTGVAIVSIFLMGAVLVITSVFKIRRANLDAQTAQDLTNEILDNVRAINTSGWPNLYNLSPKGSSTLYSVTSTASGLSIVNGSELLRIDNVAYTRYFYIENVCRDNSGGSGGTGNILGVSVDSNCASGTETEDPSSQKVTAMVTWISSSDNKSIVSRTLSEFMTRFGNATMGQSSWSGGPVGDSVAVQATTTFGSSTNIDYSSSTGAIQLQNP